MRDQAHPPDDHSSEHSRFGPPELPEWYGSFGNQPAPLFELYCSDPAEAFRFASRQGWSLHCFVVRTDEQAPTAPRFTLLRAPDPNVDDRPGVDVPLAIRRMRDELG